MCSCAMQLTRNARRLAAAEALLRIVPDDTETLAAFRVDMTRKDWHVSISSPMHCMIVSVSILKCQVSRVLRLILFQVRVSSTEAISRMQAYDPRTQTALCVNLGIYCIELFIRSIDSIDAGDRVMEVRMAAALALKHISIYLNDETVCCVLDYLENNLSRDSNDKLYLQLAFELHLTLARISPLQYAITFALAPEKMKCAIAVEAFVLSVWLHGATAVIEPSSEVHNLRSHELLH